MSGFFAIGITHGKTWQNIGTLWRSAELFGAKFIFTIGARYKKQPSDTSKAWRKVPLYNYQTIEELRAALPFDCLLVGVELDASAVPIEEFRHPPRAVYLLGAEDHGLTPLERSTCHRLIQLPGERSMNVAAAGTVTMYARHIQARRGRLGFEKAAVAAE